MDMAERTPQQIMKMQEQKTDEPFWVLPHSGIFPGKYGSPTLVRVAIMTKEGTFREAIVPVENNRPDGFVDAFAAGLQQVLVPDNPQVDGIIIGYFHLIPLGNNYSTEFSASVQLVTNGDIYVSSANGPNEHQALQNAITDGFRQVIIR